MQRHVSSNDTIIKPLSQNSCFSWDRDFPVDSEGVPLDVCKTVSQALDITFNGHVGQENIQEQIISSIRK